MAREGGEGSQAHYLHGAVEDAAEADAVLEDAVDLEDGVVRLLGVTVGHVIHVEHHLLHFSPHGPASSGGSDCCGGGYGVWAGTRQSKGGDPSVGGRVGGWMGVGGGRLQLQERKGEETVVRGRGAVLGGNWGGGSGRVDLLLLDSMTTGAAQRACTFF